MKIPVYAINLKSRVDRKSHILKEFTNRDEFSLTIVEACKHENGAFGLWMTIKDILQNLADDKNECIVLCEDDHQFTEEYSKELLFVYIEQAMKKNADILSGGVSWFNTAVQVSNALFWVQNFTGLQFTIVFKKFYKTILDADFKKGDVSDFRICSLSGDKFLIYPFISVQKEFGYSDVTSVNNKDGRVDSLFSKSSVCIQNLHKVAQFYKAADNENVRFNEPDEFENILIPTYVINLAERIDRKGHIAIQFAGRLEFDVVIVQAVKDKIGALGLWQTIRKIVELAIANDDDVIIICEDDHEFTEDYSKMFLIKNILEAHKQGVDILSGGIGYFYQTVPVTTNRFWIDNFYCTQFIVVYRKLFQKILDEPFDEKVTADGLLSEITSNKMVIFPFISVQKEFGYSDVTLRNNNEPGLMTRRFDNTKDRLEVIQRVFAAHQHSPTADHSSGRPLLDLINGINSIQMTNVFPRIVE